MTLAQVHNLGPKLQKKRIEPLAEGVIALNSHGHRDWAAMSDEELVAFARRFVEGKRIEGRAELAMGDGGLYKALRKRKLLGGVGLENSNAKHREWAAMGTEELVAFTKKFIVEKGIGGRKELAKADEGLYCALRKRRLLDSVGLSNSNLKDRSWASLSDDEIVRFARTFIVEKGISGRKKLAKADEGLYCALRKRRLLDSVGLGEKRRGWTSVSDEGLIGIARALIEEKRVDSRNEFMKADSGLYQALYKRKLLDNVFSSIGSDKHCNALVDIIASIREFGAG